MMLHSPLEFLLLMRKRLEAVTPATIAFDPLRNVQDMFVVNVQVQVGLWVEGSVEKLEGIGAGEERPGTPLKFSESDGVVEE